MFYGVGMMFLTSDLFVATPTEGRAAIQTGLLHSLERWASTHTLHTRAHAPETCVCVLQAENIRRLNLRICSAWAVRTVVLSTSISEEAEKQ